MMQTLSSLNNFSRNLEITYVDTRPIGVYCSPDVPSNQIYDITSTTVYCTPTTEIETIVGAELANCRYQISIERYGSSILGDSSISWEAIPDYLTLTQVDDVYTISGITTVTDWDLIKNFTWILPSDYESASIFFLRTKILFYSEELVGDDYIKFDTYDTNHYGIVLESYSSSSCNNQIVSIAYADFTNNVELEVEQGPNKSYKAQLVSESSFAAILERNYGLEASLTAVFEQNIIETRIRTNNAESLAVTSSDIMINYILGSTIVNAVSTATISRNYLGIKKQHSSAINATATVACIGERVYVTNNIERLYKSNIYTTTAFVNSPITIHGTQESVAYTARITGTGGKFSLATNQLPPKNSNIFEFTGTSLTDINAKFALLKFWPDKGNVGLCQYSLDLYNSVGKVLTVSNLISNNGIQIYNPVITTYNNTTSFTPSAFETYYLTYDILAIGGGAGGQGSTNYGTGGGAGGVVEVHDYNLQNLIIPGTLYANPTISAINIVQGIGGSGGTNTAPLVGYSGYSTVVAKAYDSSHIAYAGGGQAGDDFNDIGGASGSPQNYTGSSSIQYYGPNGAGAGGNAGTGTNYAPGYSSAFLLEEGTYTTIGLGSKGGTFSGGVLAQNMQPGSGGNAGYQDAFGNSGIDGIIIVKKQLVANIESFNLTLFSNIAASCIAQKPIRQQLESIMNTTITVSCTAKEILPPIQLESQIAATTTVSCTPKLQTRIQLASNIAAAATVLCTPVTITLNNLNTSRTYVMNGSTNIFSSLALSISKTSSSGATQYLADISITNGKLGNASTIAIPTISLTAASLSSLNSAIAGLVFYPTKNSTAACSINVVYKETIGGQTITLLSKTSTGTPITRSGTGAAITARTIAQTITGTVSISQLEREYANFATHLMGAGGGGSAHHGSGLKPGNGGGAGGYHSYPSLPGTGATVVGTSIYWNITIGTGGTGGTGTVAATAGSQSSIVYNGSNLIAPGGTRGAEGTGNGGQAGSYYLNGVLQRAGYAGGTGTDAFRGDGGGGYSSAGQSGTAVTFGHGGTGTNATIAGGDYMRGGCGGGSTIDAQAVDKGCGGNAGSGTTSSSVYNGQAGKNGYCLIFVS